MLPLLLELWDLNQINTIFLRVGIRKGPSPNFASLFYTLLKSSLTVVWNVYCSWHHTLYTSIRHMNLVTADDACHDYLNNIHGEGVPHRDQYTRNQRHCFLLPPSQFPSPSSPMNSKEAWSSHNYTILVVFLIPSNLRELQLFYTPASPEYLPVGILINP